MVPIKKTLCIATTFLMSLCTWGFQGIELENPEMAKETVLVGLETVRIPSVDTPSVETKSVEHKKSRLRRKRRKKRNFATYRITAYCPCCDCSDGYGRITSTGVVPRQGRTIAVDPKVIPYGAKVHIKGLGDYVAEDCGGAIKGNRIDLYFESHKEAEDFGVQYLKVYVERK